MVGTLNTLTYLLLQHKKDSITIVTEAIVMFVIAQIVLMLLLNRSENLTVT